MNKVIKCCGISDLHGNLIEINESCDIVLICGDIVPCNIQRNNERSLEWFRNEFIPWCNNLPCQYVVFIPGNHDFFLEYYRYDYICSLLSLKIVYLNDTMEEVKGVKIYGIPWCTNLKNWAFYTSDESEYNNIPECDIVLTHQPPMLGSVGMVHQIGFNYMKSFCSYKLAKALANKNIQYVLCGHVHSGNHVPEKIDSFIVNNVSILDEDYKINYEPYYFEIEVKEEND